VPDHGCEQGGGAVIYHYPKESISYVLSFQWNRWRRERDSVSTGRKHG
jgi:hypothetical protein